jgi:hypothetical protein
MSFSTGDIFLFFICLFFWYATPVIYILLTVYGILKKKEHTILIKTLAIANLLIVCNIIYYIVTLDDLSYSDSHLCFISISLAVFSPASFSLFINNQKKTTFYTYLVLFCISFFGYNAYYFSGKIAQDHEAMIKSSLEKGNLEKLQHIFNNGCPDQNITLHYLRIMAKDEIYPQQSFNFLLNCMDKNLETGYSSNNFSTYYQDAITGDNINNHLLNLLVFNYYNYLNENDKKNLVVHLISTINYQSDNKERQQIADRLNILIDNHPELTKFIKVDDKYILLMIEQGNKFMINYLKPYYSINNNNWLLAISVLSKDNTKIIMGIEKDKTILNIKILSSVGGIWGTRDVDLLSYIFRYGSADLINWLLNHSLDNAAKFDYQDQIFSYDSQQDKFYCRNYLLEYISFNPELTDKSRQSISLELKKRSRCPVTSD